MENINVECQVFTPRNIVVEVLNQVGYETDLFGKKVLENSCGDGAFLVEIVDRYIHDCIQHKMPKNEIINGLENDIFGTEIDIKHIKACKVNLDKVTQKYDITNVKWNILHDDFLKRPIKERFQFVIGNPPYVTYLNLSTDTRKYIKENFETCLEGKPDYYYAFIEMSIKILEKDGKLAYLIPNNIFKNRFADKLRIFLLPNLSTIVDFTTEKLFVNKLTSSAIIICNGTKHNNDIRYINKVKKEEIQLPKNDLKDKWIFRKKDIVKKNEKRRFGDDFNAMSSIATLLNEAFILREYKEYEQHFLVNGYEIEKKLLKEAVSPRSLQYKRKEFIIFPYSFGQENQLLRYNEIEFSQQFPNACRYLYTFIKKLNKRNKDENARWFEFGRSQALSHLNQQKLLLSTLITDEVKVHNISSNQVPYAGIFIFPTRDLSINFAEKILKSDEFLEYVYEIGVNVSGTTMRITARDVKNFEYTL